MQTNSGFSANADVVTSNSDISSVLNIIVPPVSGGGKNNS